MEDRTVYVVLVFITLLLLYLLKKKKGNALRGKTLPGPSVLEGIVTFIKGSRNKNFHLYVPKWAERFGNMVQINLLLKKIVFINDAETFRKLVKDAEFRDYTNDRPTSFCGKFYLNECRDIIFADVFGPVLQKKRKIFHNVLKFYGEGKSIFEELMLKTLKELKEEFQKKETVELSDCFYNYIQRLVGFFMDGNISPDDKSSFQTIGQYSDNAEKMFIIENETILHSFPFLRFIPGLRFKTLHDTIVAAKEKLFHVYFYPIKKNFDPNNRKGIVDELLAIQQEHEEQGSDFMSDDVIKALILNVIAAAYLTTSSTLCSLFLHLIKYPEIQNRIVDEIKKVIGDSDPTFQHRSLMPFTEAAILETLRISSNLPFLLPHFVRQDIVSDGYFIPKSAVLLMNAWYSHHREDYWDEPFTFKPERFLDASGQIVGPNDPARQRLIAFGSGRRGCPGESFGKSRVFLVTTFLLQNFEFFLDETQTLPSSDPRDWEGVTVIGPDNYVCKMRPRFR